MASRQSCNPSFPGSATALSRPSVKDGAKLVTSAAPIAPAPARVDCHVASFFRLLSVFVLVWAAPPDALSAPAPHTVRLHYQRSAGDYDGWGLHVWGEFLDLGREVTWDKPLLPKGRDGFGIYFDIPVKPGASHIYFILHQENIKNFSRDIKWQINSQGMAIWQLEDDGTIY